MENDATETVDAHGLTIAFPATSRLLGTIRSRGAYEPHVAAAIREGVPAGGHFLDIGANVGYFSLIGALAAGADGYVTAFEPDEANAALIRENSAANGLADTIEVHKVALSDRIGVLPLYRNPTNVADYRLHADGAFQQNAADLVAVTDLDSEHLTRTAVDFIKMDIQGAEGFAVEGMRETLGEQEAVGMVLEFCPEQLDASGYGWECLIDTLAEMGFGGFVVLQKHGVTTIDGLKRFMASLEAGRFYNVTCRKGPGA